MGRKIAFYIKYNDTECAPTILQFVYRLRRLGHNVDFFISDKQLLRSIRKNKYDVICLSVLSQDLAATLILAVRIKQIDAGVVTIMGNYATRGICNQLVHHVALDMAVEGEAENILPAVLRIVKRASAGSELVVPVRKAFKLTQKQPNRIRNRLGAIYYNSPITAQQAQQLMEATFERKLIIDKKTIRINVPLSNLAFRTRDGEVFHKKNIEDWSDEQLSAWYDPASGLKLEEFRQLAHPHPTEVEMNAHVGYPFDIYHKNGWSHLALRTQHGCPWGRCIFCCIKNPGARRLKVENVIKMLRTAAANGVGMVSFFDEVFDADRQWAGQLAAQIRRAGLHKRMKFYTFLKADRADEKLINSLVASGFIGFGLGVETFLPAKAEYLRKTFNGPNYVVQSAKTIDILFRANTVPCLFFIVTTPHSTLLEIASDVLHLSSTFNKCYRNYHKIPNLSAVIRLQPGPDTELVRIERCHYKRIPLTPLEFVRQPDEVIVNSEAKLFIDKIEAKKRALARQGIGIYNSPAFVLYAVDVLKDIASGMHGHKKTELISTCNRIEHNMNAIDIFEIMKNSGLKK